MNFWHMQLHPDNRYKFDGEKIRRILTEKKVIGLGDYWENKNNETVSDPNHFAKNMDIGDVVMIRSGKDPIALTEVIGDSFVTDEVDEDFDWFPLRRIIRILDFYDCAVHKKILDDCLNKYKRYSIQTQRTLTKCTNENATSEFIMRWYKMTKNSELQNDIKDFLLNAKNVILTGAPGTGKTYMAKDIAAKIVSGDDAKTYSDIEKNEELRKQIGFVQFHPSYDYTDFVEGLRPISDDGDSNQIAFERTDGVFKDFCKRAAEGFSSKGRVDNFDESLAKMIESIGDSGDFISIPYLSGSGKTGEKSFKITLNSYGTGFMRLKSESEGTNGFFNFKQLHNVYMGLPGTPKGGFDNYRKAIVKHMKENFGLKGYEPGEEDRLGGKKFVFIIDEINRGEISKIFGELFYCIDPGYRGEKGRIATQYQNLVEIGDEFKEGFYVPDNVYIIGTMNDIDRSVESMDFALRRRFAFREIEAKDTQKNILDSILKDDAILVEAEERMNSINSQICKTDGLGGSYCIGASYFANLKCYNDEDNSKRFEKLWKYNLEPLVREYLRGIDDDGGKFIDIRTAYFRTQADSSGSQENDN